MARWHTPLHPRFSKSLLGTFRQRPNKNLSSVPGEHRWQAVHLDTETQRGFKWGSWWISMTSRMIPGDDIFTHLASVSLRTVCGVRNIYKSLSEWRMICCLLEHMSGDFDVVISALLGRRKIGVYIYGLPFFWRRMLTNHPPTQMARREWQMSSCLRVRWWETEVCVELAQLFWRDALEM